ncbi:C39 family peptidase [Cytobacillus gottheilii]|uniref:C39 family peptidase n=1 Tax=Cytobacillus gottheilii TaxID=859144 RepID=UPI002494C124|nr:C39 family peptidase [Cytobacillus gottheilii]
MRRIFLVLILLIPLLACGHKETASEELQKPKAEQQNKEPNPQPMGNKKTAQSKEKISLNVPLIKQNPELKYGCEVTSLAMMLQYAGVKTNKMELYKNVSKDPDQLVKNRNNITHWGDPGKGFVGDMTGRTAGYAVFDGPIENLVNQYLPGHAVNLTKQPFQKVLDHVGKGYPAVVWTTGDYKLPDRWESWKHHKQTIKTPLDLHAVVLTGFDQQHVYLNDPLSGKKGVKVNKKQFEASWKALQSRAISYW